MELKGTRNFVLNNYCLKQLLTLPTRITKKSTSLLDHVLTNSADRVSQFGVVDTGLSDHQLIYCTRKITRTKSNVHKYIKTRSLKNYSQTLFLDKLKKANFPDYSKFKDKRCLLRLHWKSYLSN